MLLLIRLKIRPEYADLYGVDESSVLMPSAGETIRDYVVRSGIGKEENILPVVNNRTKPWNYSFSEGDVLEIYPMAASG